MFLRREISACPSVGKICSNQELGYFIDVFQVYIFQTEILYRESKIRTRACGVAFPKEVVAFARRKDFELDFAVRNLHFCNIVSAFENIYQVKFEFDLLQHCKGIATQCAVRVSIGHHYVRKRNRNQRKGRQNTDIYLLYADFGQ